MSVGTDWATGDNERFVEFHMRLPVSKQNFEAHNEMLAKSDFMGAADLLIEEFPQHEAVIRCWLDAAEQRSERESVKAERQFAPA